MNLYPVYRTPGRPIPAWQVELGAVPVIMIAIAVLIALQTFKRVRK